MAGNKNKNRLGFTLIELLVVVAIIGLLSSVILIAVMSARQKARDAARLGDVAQMTTALELYNANFKGYPASSTTSPFGVPVGLAPDYLTQVPTAPMPPDGVCQNVVHNADSCTSADSNCTNVQWNSFYYIASGTPSVINGTPVYPDYVYYFCIGNQTGNFTPGLHFRTSTTIE